MVFKIDGGKEMENNLDKFAELYITNVYDKSVKMFEMMFDGRMKGLTAQIVRDKTKTFSEEQKKIVLWLISQAVEKCVHNMLCLIDECEDVKLTYNQEDISKLSDGLAGELYADDGWISRFSTYVADDISIL